MEADSIFTDFSIEFSQALTAGYQAQSVFVKDKYHGDPTLAYSISDKIVKISPSALYEKLGGKNTLEYVSNFSQSLKNDYCFAIEIAFTALIDENSLKLIKVIPGEVGNCNECDLDAGSLLKNSYLEAEKTKTRISLGHTHPVFSLDGKTADPDRVYGALPSFIPYRTQKEVIDSFSKNKDVADEIIRTKIYKIFRADYVELFTRAQLQPLISNYCIIISPYLKQLGIFEVNDKGVIIYHPWTISD